MLSVKDLQFQYTSDKIFRFPNIECKKGEQWLILGNSGCGKTTLLHLIAGLLRPDRGSISIAGQDLSTFKGEAALDRFRGQYIGIVFQQSHLLRSLTVEQNLLAAQYLAGNTQDKTQVWTLLERLGLGNKLQSRTTQLSLGEQQRVAIARAVVNRPALILADEPTSSLDDKNCQEAAQLLIEQSTALGATLLIVTHDARLKSIIPNQIPLQ